ncbi:MAG TPA: alpha-L-rhamnosidase, partial [Porphyromonadaceae bacterium]|nr:alpha-L-rhamnosidase [Porphyromonadaceae bacterium]
ISITLGNGWYNPLPLRMWGKWNLREQLTIGDPCTTGLIQITYTDGSKDIIPTDHTWQVIPSPILRNNIYLGEHYDARLEQETINNPETVLENPRYAVKVPGPQGKLTAQLQPPIRVIQVVKPLSIREIQSGIYIVDMGQNFAG